MNIYRHQFVSSCPVNKQPIIYKLEIRSKTTIYVEKISAACQIWKRGLHEDIADDLARQFPDTHQVLTAHHHGVDLETQRP